MTPQPTDFRTSKVLSVGVVLSAGGWPLPLELSDLESLVPFSFHVSPPDQSLPLFTCLWFCLPAPPLAPTSLISPTPAHIWHSRTPAATQPSGPGYPGCSISKPFRLPCKCHQDRIPGAQGRESNLSLAGLGSLSFAAEEKGTLGLLFRFWKQARVERKELTPDLVKLLRQNLFC